MMPDGRFAETRVHVHRLSPLTARVLGVAVLVAVVAAAGAIALFALWLAMTLIPIAIGAGVIAYGVYRFQLWRAGGRSLGGQRHIYRP